MRNIITSLAIILSVHSVHAQVSGPTQYSRWSVGAYAQNLFDIRNNSMDDLSNGFSGEDMYGMNGDKTSLDLGIGARVKYSASSLISVDASATFGTMTGANQVEYYRSSISNYMLGANISLLWGGSKAQYTWIPYARFALGTSNYSCTRYLVMDDVAFNETSGNTLTADMGLGIRYYINDKWALMLESVYTRVSTDGWDGYDYGTGSDEMIRTSLGISYTFGSHANLDRKSAFHSEEIDIMSARMTQLEDKVILLSDDVAQAREASRANAMRLAKLRSSNDSTSQYVLAEVEKRYFAEQAAKEAAENMKSVYFDFNSAILNTESRNTLEAFVSALEEGAVISVQAFSDEVGNDAANIEIRSKRQESVINYLIDNGVARENIKVIPWNGVYTGVPNYDRRVEFTTVEN